MSERHPKGDAWFDKHSRASKEVVSETLEALRGMAPDEDWSEDDARETAGISSTARRMGNERTPDSRRFLAAQQRIHA